MGALQKLKAYFGMIPAEDFDEYDAEDWAAEPSRTHAHDRGHRPSYLSDEDEYEPYPPARRRLFGGLRPGYREADAVELDRREEAYLPPARPRSQPVWAAEPAPPPPPTHGALAVETRREPVSRMRPEPAAVPPAGGYPHGRIVTLHPTSYNEARAIGEHYRDGTPVIMNLTDMDDADAKRLVDFAAGLAFALRGSIDKVTNKVFLISPPNVDPSAEDKRRIAEGGLLARS
ncbi:MAG TPA: cell division protein SepF [Actinophytocola sp.]|uniref:cell division protein SepF n=1 Tax=Actinophytocola sp. TaxID=1872138 RepID=UPI002DB6C27B|nr:cell division protein SepF [Actinophytocola sp.]HEU5471543.1 cell division protein SepF [Actinophytocola sp.]